jgi:exopolysaccharide biosynthesis polyprenyl glycosylphosphotransferase
VSFKSRILAGASTTSPAGAYTPRAVDLSHRPPEPVAGDAEAPATAGEGRQARRIRRGWLVRRMLLAADVAGLVVAFIAIELLFRGNGAVDEVGIALESVIFVLALPAWIVAAKLYGLYDRDEERATHSTADEVMSVFHLITVGVLGFYATSWLVGLSRPDQAKLSTFWVLAMLGVISARLVTRSLARRHPAYVQNTVVIGAGDVGQLVGRKLLQHPEYRIRLVGFVDAHPKELRRDLQEVQILGEPDEIVDIVRRHGIDRVIIAFSQDLPEQMLKLVFALRQCDVQVDVVPRLFEALGPNAALHGIEGLPLVGLPATRIPRSSRLLKRGVDIVGASVLLTFAAAIMLVIGILIRRDSPGPVFFRQVRLGIDMREFTLLKFRTMRTGTDEMPHREYLKQIMTSDALPTSNNLYKLERPEVTRVGRWLRKTSLDELPQLLNVLRGDMSLVGPRPSIPYELELFAPHHYERFLVPPGLTGLWQVEARAHSTFREALDLDVMYARGWSFGLDLRLLLRTPALILRGSETG